MNYEDEDYVRLFTRDTPTWKSWKWEAKATIGPLMRKLDRDGRLDWPPGGDAGVYVAASIDIPVKVVVVALREFIRTETITMDDRGLSMPNFVPGQNAARRTKSRAERTSEWKTRVGYKHPSKTKRGDTVETPGDIASPAETKTPFPYASPSLPSAAIAPFGSSPPSPAASGVSSRLPPKPEPTPREPSVANLQPTASPAAQVLTHPAAEPGGKAGAMRRKQAAEVWAWHESERVRRLCAVETAPRGHEPSDLNAIVRLLDHVRRRHQCDEAAAWERVRAFRLRALEQAEEALRTGRVAYPDAKTQMQWARTGTAWSSKSYDILEEQAPDPRAAKAAADAEFAAEVARRKAAARGSM